VGRRIISVFEDNAMDKSKYNFTVISLQLAFVGLS
jgi:hypothetical protein